MPGRRVLPLLAALAALAAGCGDDDTVAGLWQTPAGDPAVEFSFLEPPRTVHVRLATDQFGQDVAGVLQLSADDLYYDIIECAYVEEGQVLQGKFLFSFELADGRRLDAVFVRSDDAGAERLIGTITDADDPSLPGISITLERVGDGGDLHEEGLDLGCADR